MTRRVLGIDIGGTKLLVAVVDETGAVLSRVREPTNVAEGPDRILARTVGMAKAAIAQSGVDVSSIGVGCAGPLDPRRGVVLSPPNLPGWVDVPLRAYLARELSLDVVLDNDANAAGVGEHHFGAARGVDDFLYVTVSTGIGGAAFVDGRLLHGRDGNAAEIGHMSVAWDGWPCPCGSTGCVEAFAAGPHIARRARAAASPAMIGLAGSVEAITAAHVVAAVQQGDPGARQIWDDTIEVLGAGIANAINAYNPRLVVMGGGVSEAGAILVDAVGVVARRRALPQLGAGVQFVKAALGSDVGVLGAAALAFAAS